MKGFSIVEILVSLSIFSVFIAISFASYTQLEKFFYQRSAEEEIRTVLDRARNLAIGINNGNGWSFRIEGDKAMIFLGNNYSSRDVGHDEFYDLPAKTTATTTSDIYFNPMTGFISSSATTTISVSGSSTSVTISKYGIIK
ncbi:MAG: hypothetical protein RLZZ546_1424 [Bacteroidota bacterium]